MKINLWFLDPKTRLRFYIERTRLRLGFGAPHEQKTPFELRSALIMAVASFYLPPVENQNVIQTPSGHDS